VREGDLEADPTRPKHRFCRYFVSGAVQGSNLPTDGYIGLPVLKMGRIRLQQNGLSGVRAPDRALQRGLGIEPLVQRSK
jgi:hypothetical protein